MNSGKKISQTDYIVEDVLNRMSLTLDYDLTFEKESIVPKLWHWLFFLPQVKASEVGADGHPETGGFIPKIEGCRENDDVHLWVINDSGLETMSAQARISE